MLNVCMIGHGMMGRWHSEALRLEKDCKLHLLVGRRAESTEAFAREFGYAAWTTNLDHAIADPAVDIFIIATPSEDHAGTALRCLKSRRHTLLEIPIGMSLDQAQKVVAAARASGCKFALVYPMRMMPEFQALKARIDAGAERVRLVEARFLISRWENVGATGYQRSWTDNLLWHHMGHLVDFALWISNSPAVHVSGFMPPPDPRTGTPMDAMVTIATAAEQSLVILGSYASPVSICQTLVLTDRDVYRLDAMTSRLETSSGTSQLADEQVDCAAALRDFLDAVRLDRRPAITGESVLPMMSALQQIQDAWDRRFGAQVLPGRGVVE